MRSFRALRQLSYAGALAVLTGLCAFGCQKKEEVADSTPAPAAIAKSAGAPETAAGGGSPAAMLQDAQLAAQTKNWEEAATLISLAQESMSTSPLPEKQYEARINALKQVRAQLTDAANAGDARAKAALEQMKRNHRPGRR